MKKKILISSVAVLLYIGMAIGIMWLLKSGGNYPQGSDTMCHVYKGDILYKEIKQGNWYPLYDEYWYNGVQMMRFWAPLPVYCLALCDFLMGGSPVYGYNLFCALVFLFGAVSWLAIGLKKDRPFLGAIIGILWFLMPNNLYALFVEGNLPRSLSMILLPLLIHFMCEYLYEKRKTMLQLSLIMMAVALCHVGYAMMIFASVVLMLVIYKIAYPGGQKIYKVIASMGSGILITGVWLVPSLIGGITSTDSSQVMASFFQSMWKSINPVLRITEGHASFYFGCAAFIVMIFACIFAGRESKPGMIAAAVIFFLTTSTMYEILVKLPGSQYFWMLRFISIALAMILYSIIMWKKLKKWILILLVLLLFADTVPSLNLIYKGSSKIDAETEMQSLSESILIDEAKQITTQRLAIMDESTLGAMAPFLLSDFGAKNVPGTFGAGWQSAATGPNIVLLNEAMDNGYYDYMFDRILSMGNDTVIIRKACLPYSEDVDEVKAAASETGYDLIDENGGYMLFNIDTYDNFGIQSDYSLVGIGQSSKNMSMVYPSMRETADNNLNNYTFEDLKDCKMIYLDHFTYTDKKAAEDLIKKLADSGVRIVIDAGGIPENPQMKIPEFLGVTCNTILFENGYPLLYVNDKEVDCNLFKNGYSDWNTVYINGCDEEIGVMWDHNVKECFLGRTYNENIYIVGLNLGYHLYLTKDENVKRIFDTFMIEEATQLPKRTIVPINVTTKTKEIIIESEYDNVNTTLAYHDIFEGKGIYNDFNLLTVNSGRTSITLKYPYLWQGIAVSLLGVVLTVLLAFVKRKSRGYSI